jgi:hypothetical protein
VILEAVVTTLDAAGTLNVAPLGPWVDPQLTRFTLKPFRPSRTYDNLKATGHATIHVTDDVYLIARCVTHTLEAPPPHHAVGEGRFRVLDDACRYFCVEVTRWDDDPLRATAHCAVVEQGELRPWFGFNRAKHATLEAAILASRAHMIDADDLHRQLRQLSVAVEKTAGPRERAAFDLIVDYVRRGSGEHHLSHGEVDHDA